MRDHGRAKPLLTPRVLTVYKRSREESYEFSEHLMKFAAARASPGVVSIVTHDVPEEMCKNFQNYTKAMPPPPKDVIFFGCGLIVECQKSSSSSKRLSRSGKYVCKVIAPASLFQRPDHVEPNSIKIDVLGLTAELYKAKLLGCDFHYNLAVITFKSKSPFPTVTFKAIDDVLSIYPSDKLPSSQNQNSRFQLRPHSNLFKVSPGTRIFSVCRTFIPPYPLHSGSGFFSSSCPDTFGCNELYEIKDSTYAGKDGGPVLNCYGDVLGIIFNTSSFLPSNIVTRWWKHFKTTGEFCRPFLGLEVANLHDADLDFLALTTTKFPDISSGVIVTKVEKDSPAFCSGIQIKDVIVKLDDKQVMSKLKFFETIWDKEEKSVEFNVRRVIDGEELNLSLVIGEASPDKFHQWMHPGWSSIRNDAFFEKCFGRSVLVSR